MSETIEEIQLGSIVTLSDPDREGRTIRFTLVNENKADLSKGWISLEAPMAKAVLGRHKGDDVTVRAPRAKRHYKVVSHE